MSQDWTYGILDDAVRKDSSNLSLTKIEGDDGDYPVFGAKGFLQNVSFYQQESEYLGIIKDGAGIGRVSKHPEKSSILATMQYILPKEGFDIQFINYFLNYIDFEKYRTGSTIPHIYYKDYKSEPFPLVALDEQKRIVSKLDECFEAIDKARANVERNLQNAKELFQSQLNQIFSQKGDGWVEKKLGEVCIVERGSSPRPIKDYITESEDGVNWVKIGDTKNVEKYIHTTKQKITKEGAKRSRFVDVGDFILTNSMTYGKPYIMKTQGYIHDGWFVLRLPDEINSEFFWYLLASPYTMEQFEYLAAGAIVKNISGDLVKKAILPIPPIGEQASIVEKLDTLSSQTQSLEASYQQELDALDELKKSILQKAFNGEL